MRIHTQHAPTRFTVGAMLLSAGLLPLVLLAACDDEPQPRRYREIVAKNEGSNLQRGPLSDISWKLPEGWTVQPEGDPLAALIARAERPTSLPSAGTEPVARRRP